MKVKEKFDLHQEFVKIKELLSESETLWSELKKGKHRDTWKKSRGDDSFELLGSDVVNISKYDNRITYTKSLGFGSYVEIRTYSHYNKKETVYTSVRYFTDNGDYNHEEHRTDGPAKITTKDFKRASCEYYLNGAKVPQYFYEQNFSKIQYMASVVNIIRKKYPTHHVVSKPKEGFIRIELPEKFIKYEDMVSFVEGLKVSVSKNFNFSLLAGYDMTLSIRMYFSKDANIENDTVLEKNSDFFN